MERFIKAIRKSMETQNWYAALILALTMPDICGRIENPKFSSSKRSIIWWDTYMLGKYSYTPAGSRGRAISLEGADVYALRCAYLHEGRSTIENQAAKKALNDFIFISPNPGIYMHCNRINNVLQLQVDCFCEDITQGVESWMEAVDYAKLTKNNQYSLLSIKNSLHLLT